jgi:hypothetical protein
MGGTADGANAVAADVWTSTDGVNWTQITPSTTFFGDRYSHAAGVLNGSIFVIGGLSTVGTPGATYQDLWATDNGREWMKIEDKEPFFAFPWKARHNMGVTVFNMNPDATVEPYEDMNAIVVMTGGADFNLVPPFVYGEVFATANGIEFSMEKLALPRYTDFWVNFDVMQYKVNVEFWWEGDVASLDIKGPNDPRSKRACPVIPNYVSVIYEYLPAGSHSFRIFHDLVGGSAQTAKNLRVRISAYLYDPKFLRITFPIGQTDGDLDTLDIKLVVPFCVCNGYTYKFPHGSDVSHEVIPGTDNWTWVIDDNTDNLLPQYATIEVIP